MGEQGHLTVDHVLIENCAHEGVALSCLGAEPKSATLRHLVVTGCQQGVELGFSDVALQADLSLSTVTGNAVGVRIGDNYGWATAGRLTVRDSVVSGNGRDVWNFHRVLFAPLPDQLVMSGNIVGAQVAGVSSSFVVVVVVSDEVSSVSRHSVDGAPSGIAGQNRHCHDTEPVG
jgi:hypothetical protein